MSNIDYIINLCFDISEQGKTPSVALIRNMAKHSLPIPEVVKALQHWKSNPNARPKHRPVKETSSPEGKVSLEQRVTQLENQISIIMQELAKIKN